MAAAGCAGGELGAAEDPSSTDAIIGGQYDSAHPSVGFLGIQASGSYWAICTGTLIADRIVLTAAHCAQADVFGTSLADHIRAGRGIMHFRTGGGQDPSRTVTMKVQSIDLAPGYTLPLSSPDLAIVRLAGDAPATLPRVPFLQEDVASIPGARGMTVTAVGWGLTNAKPILSDALGRRFRNTTLTGWDAVGVTTGEATCFGDSGGPLLAVRNGREVIIGVTWKGPADCRGTSSYTRVDRVASFIRGFLGPVCGDNNCERGEWQGDAGYCQADCAPYAYSAPACDPEYTAKFNYSVRGCQSNGFTYDYASGLCGCPAPVWSCRLASFPPLEDEGTCRRAGFSWHSDDDECGCN